MRQCSSPGISDSLNPIITLLGTGGVASIVGTVLKQNETYQNFSFKLLVIEFNDHLRSWPGKA